VVLASSFMGVSRIRLFFSPNLAGANYPIKPAIPGELRLQSVVREQVGRRKEKNPTHSGFHPRPKCSSSPSIGRAFRPDMLVYSTRGRSVKKIYMKSALRRFFDSVWWSRQHEALKQRRGVANTRRPVYLLTDGRSIGDQEVVPFFATGCRGHRLFRRRDPGSCYAAAGGP